MSIIRGSSDIVLAARHPIDAWYSTVGACTEITWWWWQIICSKRVEDNVTGINKLKKSRHLVCFSHVLWCAVWRKYTDVSEKLTAYLFRIEIHSSLQSGGSIQMFRRNFLPSSTGQNEASYAVCHQCKTFRRTWLPLSSGYKDNIKTVTSVRPNCFFPPCFQFIFQNL
jgi:hypothetical protein